MEAAEVVPGGFTRAKGAPRLGLESICTAHSRRVTPRLTFHGLRHSHATALLTTAEHVKVVTERLGHYSSTFTLDTYASVLKGMQQDAAARLATGRSIEHR